MNPDVSLWERTCPRLASGLTFLMAVFLKEIKKRSNMEKTSGFESGIWGFETGFLLL
jgi:hypothetical protein